ncbi:MAG: hypothetical protein ABIL68_01845 [bacterium]
MPYPKADRDRLRVFPLTSRISKTNIEEIAVNPDSTPPAAPQLEDAVQEAAHRIVTAKEEDASIILAFGAHLIKNGVGPIVIKMMENGWFTHLATQGAGSIHDWEFAYLGQTEEDVRANVATGTFGTWDETGKYINLAVQVGAVRGMGYGESVGALIQEEGLDIPSASTLKEDVSNNLSSHDKILPAKVELLNTVGKFHLRSGFMKIPHPYKKYSVLGNAFRMRVPVTVHPGIGYDIIYNHPYANGGALGRGGHTDYEIFVRAVSRLRHGVFISVGSSVMAPQVFEKALSFANNLRPQNGERITDHYLLVNDLIESEWDWTKGEPPKSSPDYYLRFFKTFYRMGGTVRYVSSDHRVFLHHLYAKLKELSK